MDARTLSRTNGAKAGELVGTIGGAAKALGEAAGPWAGRIEDRAGTFVKTVEVRAVPLAAAVGTKVEALAKTVEKRAAPVAEAVGTTAESVAEEVGEKLERTGKDLMSGIRNFKFGKREGLLLGLTLGVFATVWLVSRVDRRAAARTLRSAGSRVGDATQELTSRVGQATQALPSRAGALAGLGRERAALVAQAVGARANQAVQQVRGGQVDASVEDAKLRLAETAAPAHDDKPKTARRTKAAEGPGDDNGSGLDRDTRAAINEAAEEAERVEQARVRTAAELGLSNGMKVVGFDGTDIGRVQEVREQAFVLDRPKGSDLLVPLTEVARIEGTVAYLRIEADRLTKMGWDQA